MHLDNRTRLLGHAACAMVVVVTGHKINVAYIITGGGKNYESEELTIGSESH